MNIPYGERRRLSGICSKACNEIVLRGADNATANGEVGGKHITVTAAVINDGFNTRAAKIVRCSIDGKPAQLIDLRRMALEADL